MGKETVPGAREGAQPWGGGTGSAGATGEEGLGDGALRWEPLGAAHLLALKPLCGSCAAPRGVPVPA